MSNLPTIGNIRKYQRTYKPKSVSYTHLDVYKRQEQASVYIHKLAGIYRYMLQNEEETLVRLHEEMAFVGMYVDLLQVRFPEGFRVETDISDEVMNRHVLPCSVQLLIENAIKHNSVGADRPLVIRLSLIHI